MAASADQQLSRGVGAQEALVRYWNGRAGEPLCLADAMGVSIGLRATVVIGDVEHGRGCVINSVVRAFMAVSRSSEKT